MMKLVMGTEGEGEEEQASSECSSGCQSGWTMYLDQSYESPPFHKAGSSEHEHEHEHEDEDEEEEDLSMVSDASSGPPHHREEEEHLPCCSAIGVGYASARPVLSAAKDAGGKKRRLQSEQRRQHPPSFLDDTASSPLFDNSQISSTNSTMESVADFSSCAFSATHLKKTALQKHLDYIHPSAPLKPTPTKTWEQGGWQEEDVVMGRLKRKEWKYMHA